MAGFFYVLSVLKPKRKNKYVVDDLGVPCACGFGRALRYIPTAAPWGMPLRSLTRESMPTRIKAVYLPAYGMAFSRAARSNPPSEIVTPRMNSDPPA